MDMVQATGLIDLSLNDLPTDNFVTSGSTRVGDTADDNDIMRTVHGYAMATAAIFIAPLDLLAARALTQHIKWHIFASVLYLIVVLAGLALAVLGLSQQLMKVCP
jgi:hypothetical protein